MSPLTKGNQFRPRMGGQPTVTAVSQDRDAYTEIIEAALMGIRYSLMQMQPLPQQIHDMEERIAEVRTRMANTQEKIDEDIRVIEETAREMHVAVPGPLPDGVRIEPEKVFVYTDDMAFDWCINTGHSEFISVDRPKLDAHLAARGKLPMGFTYDVVYHVIIEALEEGEE